MSKDIEQTPVIKQRDFSQDEINRLSAFYDILIQIDTRLKKEKLLKEVNNRGK